MRPVTGALIVAVVTIPWYLYMNAKTGGAFFREFLLIEHMEKFTGAAGIYSTGTNTPVWYYVPQMLARFLPWSLFLPFGLWWLTHNRKEPAPHTWLLIAWFAFGFVFLSAADYKRADYLLPLYPVLALLTARYIVHPTAGRQGLAGIRVDAWLLAGLIALASLGAIGLVLSGWLEAQLGDPSSALSRLHRKDVAIARAYSENIISFTIMTVAFLGAVMLAAWFFGRRRLVPGAYALAAAMAGVLLYLNVVVHPILDRFDSYRDFTLRLVERADAGERVAFHRFCEHEISFYLGRGIEGNGADDTLNEFLDRQGIDYLITRTENHDALPPALKRRLPVVDRTLPGSHRPLVLSKVKRDDTAGADGGN